ncbi:MAG TPA: NFACT family protein [Treponemataceae bacterium]|nr:NFACT family protein [Treponemataceae bacterium]
MSLNWKEINAVVDELDLSGSFIQKIIQPNYDSIAFYTYTANKGPRTILVCLAAGVCRIHETRKKIPKHETPLRFMEFLRKQIKGSRIQSCEQLNNDRIIKFTLTNRAETFFMFIRLWSGAANIIVTDPSLTILDVFYRRPKRNEISRGIFALPEPRTACQTESKQKNTDRTKTFTVRSFDELDKPDCSFNQKVELWYSEHGKSLSREALLEQAERKYKTQRKKLETAISRLEKKRRSFLSAETWKHQGDLILTYGHIINGESNFLECHDYENDQIVKIEIDPRKNAQDNAIVYYDKYKKSISGLSKLEHDIKNAQETILDLENNYKACLQEENPIRMQQMLRKQSTPRQKIKNKQPGLRYHIKGWHIIVGRTARENDTLLRHYVKGRDMWLHTRDWPGGYVFIKQQRNKTVPLEILLDAGTLAVYYSKGRKARTCDLYYTEVKHLRRAKNGPKGLVLPTNEKNLTITLDEVRLNKIHSQQDI